MAFYGLYVAVCCLVMLSLTQASKIEDVLDLDFEPRIAIQCGKQPKYVDVKTGQWTDANKQDFCSTDPEEILKFCKETYPDIDVTNIVEANANVTVCANAECKSSYSVVPYRCLVGRFEADAISQPFVGECNFGYVHETKTCKNHAYWKERAVKICEGKGKYLEKFGILAPCGTDLFSGVEYNCCKNPTTESITPSTQAPTTKPKTDAEILEDLLNKFAARIPAKSKGCDRSIYTAKLDLLRSEKDATVGKLAQNLKEAKARMEELKKDDADQAKSSFKKMLQILQGSLKNINQKAKLDESQLNQEKKECAQMMLNHKKHLAMKTFVNAVRQHSEPTKIIKSFQRFMRILQHDQEQNMHTLSKKVLAKHPDKLMSARDVFLKHLNVVKSVLKEGVDILRKVETVHGKIKFDLPPFATDIDFEFAHKPKTTPPPPTTEAPIVDEDDGAIGLDEDELSDENEHYPTQGEPKPRISGGLKVPHRDHPLKSRAVFAAVIGLSCGALVIMIVIVVALFIRKGSPKRSTKTVIADDDSQEKRHLLKMQEDGFENPTYKFFSN